MLGSSCVFRRCRALVGVVLAATLATTAAVAQPIPQHALDQALAAIETGFAGPPGSGGTFPDPDTPAVAGHLQVIRSTMDAFGTPVFPAGDLSMLDKVCGRLNAVMQRYMLFDLTAIIARKEKTFEAVVAANMARFQAEIFVFIPAVVKCHAIMLPALEAFWINLPPADRTSIRVEGVQRARAGSTRSLLGLAMMAGEPQHTGANQTTAIKTVAAAAPAYAGVLPLAERQSLLAAIKGLAGISQRFPAEVAAIEQALSNQVCLALCQIPSAAPK